MSLKLFITLGIFLLYCAFYYLCVSPSPTSLLSIFNISLFHHFHVPFSPFTRSLLLGFQCCNKSMYFTFKKKKKSGMNKLQIGLYFVFLVDQKISCFSLKPTVMWNTALSELSNLFPHSFHARF